MHQLLLLLLYILQFCAFLLLLLFFRRRINNPAILLWQAQQAQSLPTHSNPLCFHRPASKNQKKHNIKLKWKKGRDFISYFSIIITI